MLSKLRAAVLTALHENSLFGKIEEIADNRRHTRNEEVKKARGRVQSAHGEFEMLLDREHTLGERDNARQILGLAEQHLASVLKKREFWRNRYVWARERHEHWGDVWKHRRDRVRRWVLQHDGFKPYMANGRPYEKLSDTCKHAIYLDFRHGLYVTSTYEGFPGDGVHATTSYHYLENQPESVGRCWDAGSANRGPMVKTQQRQAEEFPAYLVEMFGPQNDLAFKNGVRFTLPEGSELETMHDNHVHTDVRDGAFA